MVLVRSFFGGIKKVRELILVNGKKDVVYDISIGNEYEIDLK